MERVAGLAQGASEIFDRDWTKREASDRTTGNVGPFNINDGVRKATDP